MPGDSPFPIAGGIMRLLTRVGFGVAALAVATFMPARTEAATLAFTHVVNGTNTFYTLNVATGCQVCAVSLTIEYEDPDGGGSLENHYSGSFLESVQWIVDDFKFTDDADIGLQTAPGGTGVWDFQLGPLSNNGCNFNTGNKSACGNYTGAGTGFPVPNGGTLTFTFLSDFGVVLPDDLGSGNVRASYNNASGGNFGPIFSPGGGNFGGDGDGGGGGGIVVPEPASLALLGLGLLGIASRKRRRVS
jgi:hypothetical protein